jgi:PAS domain S-box-containing protein
VAHQIFPRSDLEETLAPRGASGPSHHWMTALADGAPAALIVDMAGNLLYANSAYGELVRSIDPNLRGAVGEPSIVSGRVLTRALNGDGPVEDKQLHKTATGVIATQSRYWRLPAAPGVMGERSLQVAGFIFDNTREVDALRIGRQARARFDDIAHLTSDWVWEVNDNFRFTYVSSRVAEILGLPAQALKGQSLFDIGQFDGFEQANRREHPRMESRVPFSQIVCRIAAADGAAHLFELSGVPIFDDRAGKFLGYRGTAGDITARSEAEEEATRAQLNLINAVESMPQGFVLRDSRDRVQLCNSEFEEIISPDGDMIEPGTDYCDLVRRAAENGVFDCSGEALEDFIAERTAAHQPARQEAEFRLSDGRWMQLIGEMTENGGVIETWIDITRMKEREAELLEAEAIARHGREQAEHANRTKSEFLANMSHELRTPLNAIIGFSEIIQNEVLGPLGNEQYTSYAGDIHESGIHLLGLINDILDYSKAEAGKITLNNQPLDLAVLVDSCLRLVAPRAEETGIAMIANIPEDCPKISADMIRLKQILINLLSNGVKFTEAGSVTIEAECDRETGIVIRVRDTGIGIAEENIAQAFSLFGQVDSALSRKFEGTGLGLPLSRSLAQLHGGDLTLESELGVGTTAIVTLPADRIVQN